MGNTSTIGERGSKKESYRRRIPSNGEGEKTSAVTRSKNSNRGSGDSDRVKQLGRVRRTRNGPTMPISTGVERIKGRRKRRTAVKSSGRSTIINNNGRARLPTEVTEEKRGKSCRSTGERDPRPRGTSERKAGQRRRQTSRGGVKREARERGLMFSGQRCEGRHPLPPKKDRGVLKSA